MARELKLCRVALNICISSMVFPEGGVTVLKKGPGLIALMIKQ